MTDTNPDLDAMIEEKDAQATGRTCSTCGGITKPMRKDTRNQIACDTCFSGWTFANMAYRNEWQVISNERASTLDDASLQAMIEELLEAHKKATSGEWWQYKNYGWVYAGDKDSEKGKQVADCPTFCDADMPQASLDAHFIALSHNTLIPILEALRGKVEEAKKFGAWVREKITTCHPTIEVREDSDNYGLMNVLSSRAQVYDNYIATRKNDVAELEDKVAQLEASLQLATERMGAAEAESAGYLSLLQQAMACVSKSAFPQVYTDYEKIISEGQIGKGFLERLKGAERERDEAQRAYSIIRDDWNNIEGEKERLRQRLSQLEAENQTLRVWMNKICAIVQPAQNADEWGADVADIVAERLAASATRAEMQAQEVERLSKKLTLAERIHEGTYAECDVTEALDEIIPGDIVDRIGTDHYDNSLEVYMSENTPADWTVTQEIADKIFAMGFSCFWFNFANGTEQAVGRMGIGKRKPVDRPRWSKEAADDYSLKSTRVVAALTNELAMVKADLEKLRAEYKLETDGTLKDARTIAKSQTKIDKLEAEILSLTASLAAATTSAVEMAKEAFLTLSCTESEWRMCPDEWLSAGLRYGIGNGLIEKHPERIWYRWVASAREDTCEK